jgi:uncharacterized protein
MKVWPTLFTFSAFVNLACWNSPPTRFFTFESIPPASKPHANSKYVIQIDAVQIPAELDRNAIVKETGPDTLSISQQDHWAAPLGELARDALTQDLASRLPNGTVILPQAPTPSSAAQLEVTIAKFTENSDRRVVLEASWTLLKGQPAHPVLTRDVHLECEATDSGAEAQAAGMSKLIAQLADNITYELTLPSAVRSPT